MALKPSYEKLEKKVINLELAFEKGRQNETRLRAERDALKERNNLLEQMVQFLPQGVAAVNAEGRVIVWNRMAEEILETPAEDIMGKKTLDVGRAFYGKPKPTLLDLALQLRDGHDEAYEKFKTANSAITAAVTIPNFKGKGVDRYFTGKAQTLFDSKGHIIGAVETIQDETEKNNITAELKNNEARYRSLVETSQDWIWEVDANGKVIYSSPAVANIWGYAPEEIVGKKIGELFQNEEAIRIDSLYRKLTAAKENINGLEVQIHHKNGKLVWIETSGTPLFGNDGQFKGFCGINRDVTEKKKFLQKIQKKESMLRKAQRMGNLGCWEWDIATNNVIASDSFLNLVGLDPKPSFSLSLDAWIDIIHPDDRDQYIQVLQDSLSFSGEQTVTYRIIHKDLGVRNFKAVAEYIRDRDGNPISAFGTVQDITEYVQTAKTIESLNATLYSIRAVNQLIVREKNRKRLLRKSCQILTSNPDMKGAWIQLLDDAGQPVENSCAGLGGDLVSLIAEIKKGVSPNWKQDACLKTMVDIPADRESFCGVFYDKNSNLYYQVFTFNLLKNNKSYGLLSLYNIHTGKQIKEKISLLKEIAEDIAFALHSMALDEEKKGLVESLRQSENRYHMLVDTCPDMISIIQENKVLYANKTVIEKLGWTLDEMQSNSFDWIKLVIPPKHRSLVKKNLYKHYKKEVVKPYQITMKRKNGSEFPVIIRSVPIRVEENQAILSYHIDLTKYSEMKEAIRQSEVKFKALWESLPIIAYEVDSSATIRNVNNEEKFAEIVNLPVGKIINSSIFKCVEKQSLQQAKYLYRSVLNGETSEFELKLASNKTGWFRLKRIANKHGKIIGLIGILMDITEQKIIQEQLMRADRLSSMAHLSAGIAHEIRNPLSSISLFLDILCDQVLTDKSDQVEDILKELKENVDRIANIISRVLDFSRPTVTNEGNIDIKNLINDTIRLWSDKFRRKKIDCEVSIADNIDVFWGDPVGIQQVFGNLIQNAIEAIGTKGAVNINACKINNDNQKNDSNIIIKVKDNGPGINPTDIKQIWEPFFTKGKRYGTGLGLAICHQIVEKYGGHISCESTIGKGTTFTIELPVKK